MLGSFAGSAFLRLFFSAVHYWQLLQLLLLVSHHSQLCAQLRPCFSPCAAQLWGSYRAVLEAEDAAAMGLTFTLTCDWLGQPVDVPLGGAGGDAAAGLCFS